MTAPTGAEHRRVCARSAGFYPYLLLGLAALLWAGNWVIARAIRDAMPPVALNFWRWAVAVLILAPFALPRLRGKGATLRRHWLVLFLLGLSGIAFFQIVIYVGLRYTNAVNAVLMNSASPLFIILLAWLMEGETATLRQLAGMLISFCGILVIINHGDLATLREFRFNPGDLLILLGMPTWGLYAVLLRRRPSELDGISLLFVTAAAALAIMLPFYVAESVFLAPARLSWGTAGAALYTGAFASAGAYICWNRGVALVGPNRAGFTMHLLPAFGTLLAVLLLGEEVHPFHAAGIAVILFGVWLASSAPAR